MKLTCDICGGELEMKAGGQGAICTTCGLAYSVARLKEKLGVQSAAKPVEEDAVYDVADYEVVDESRCSAEKAREALRAVLVQTYGENAVFPDGLIGRDTSAQADFLVRAKGCWPAAFFIVSRPDDAQAYQRAVNAGKIWEARDAYWFIVFERDCLNSEYIKQWVRFAMEKTVKP